MLLLVRVRAAVPLAAAAAAIAVLHSCPRTTHKNQKSADGNDDMDANNGKGG